MNVAFPLRDGYFPPLQATPEDRARWTRRMREHVQQSLEEEKPFFASGYEAIDRRQWKLVRRKDQLRVFRPRREGSSSSSHNSDGARLPCLLEIGTIEGSLEDVIYGAHSASTHDMRTTTAFLSADALDAAVLGVFENGSRDDMYRSFALKWRILETPAGSLVKNRDVLALEYMGISRDADGERFAFHICDSFDHPACPPFHTLCSVRARTHTRIIYRQVRPGRVGVYYRAEYASGGRIPKLLARWTAAEVAVSIGRSVECAEAKKLTAIALAAHGSELSKRAVERRARGLSGSARACSICDQHAAHKALHACDVCGASVCARCRSRKFLLSDEGKVQVACCKQCIVAAKTMRADARQPLGIISAAYWHGYGAIVSATASPPRSGTTFADEHDDIGDHDAVAVSRASSTASQAAVRPRGRTLEHQHPYHLGSDDDDEQKPRSTRSDWKRAMDRRRTREDVYELLAAMSTASESTVESMASRDDASVVTSDSFLDVDDDVDSPRAETKRKASRVVPMAVPVARPQLDEAQPASELSNEDAAHPLWLQMKQLRVAAEQTYRITKKTSESFVR